MISNEKGFSLTELLVTLVIFVIVIAASSQVFTTLLTNFKQQGKISETYTEGLVGLEMLRRDLDHAGFGLPYALNGAPYQEAVAESGQTFWTDRDLNDGPPDNPARGTDLGSVPGNEHSNPPGAFRSLNNPGIHNSDSGAGFTNQKIANSVADVLAIKATAVGMTDTGQKWSYITDSWGTTTMKSWGTGSDAFRNGEFITVMQPIDGTLKKSLKWNAGTAFYTTFGSTIAVAPPANSLTSYIMYGVSDTLPRMPFNRVDYYVKRPASGMPARCAPKLGILYKSVLNQSDGKHTEYPILDCVADFQVYYVLSDTTGATDCDAGGLPVCGDISNLTAENIRDRLREVHVYVVAQEGQKDVKYDYSGGVTTKVAERTFEVFGANSRTLNFVDLSLVVGTPEYKYYHWKLYTLIIKPGNL